MSQLYTSEQITADISRHEGVIVQPTQEVSAMFLKLYSEIHQTPMNDGKTVDDLKKRIDHFMNHCGVVVPSDMEIDWDKQYNIFEMTTGETIADSKTKFYASADTLAELNAIPVSSEREYALVDTLSRTVKYLTQEIH